jgi:hypothetical protein
MPALPPLVRKCIAETSAASGRVLGACIDHTVAKLQDDELRASQPTQRQELGGAWRELTRQKGSWMARFPKLLHTAFEKAASPEGAEPAQPKLRPSSLTLVDDNEVAQTIEASRLGQALVSKLEQPLAELDALMSSALGLDAIRPEQNPLRPDVFAQTLRALMSGPDIQPTWPGMWLRLMAEPLTAELDKLYRETSRRITQARVQAAGYKVLGTPSRPADLRSDSQLGGLGPATGQGALGPSTRAGPVSGQGGERMRGASAFAELPNQELSGSMFQEFLFRGGAQASHALAPSYYERVEQELAALEAITERQIYDMQAALAHRHLPAVQRPARHVGVDSPLDDQVWGKLGASHERALVRSRLKKEAQNVGQVLGLEVVRKLVDQVAQDPRLLAPVREAIVALEPSLLRLAMVSPRFFSEEDHPGRRLVEQVAERSFKYNDEFSTEFFEFFRSVSTTFNKLNALEEIEDAHEFRDALSTLEAQWAEHDRDEEARRQQVLTGMQKAEKRQAEADRIAKELAQRSDLKGAPQAVQDFLFGPWSLVMAHARLNDTKREIDPGGYGSVITDLLWSIKRELALRDPAKAFELIPRVLLKLRSGLAALGQQQGDNEAFFRALEKLHRPIMKLRLRSRRDTHDSVMDLPPDDDDLLPSQPAEAEAVEGHLWMAPQELQELGFEDTQPSDLAPLLAEGHTDIVHRPEPVTLDDGEVDAIIGGLTQGCWVDLFSKQTWRRAQLIWAAAKGTLFMFTSHGGQPHSMTRRSLQRLVRDRLLRPVEADAVVPRAIEKISREPAHA